MIVALDCETPDLLWESPVIGFSTYDGETSWWWPRYQFENLREYLSEAKTIIMHNAKFDLQKAILEEVWPSSWLTVIDTEAIAHLLDEHQLKGLKTLAKSILGESTDEAEKLKAVRKELGLTKADGFGKIPEEILIPYALKDAEYTYNLYLRLWPQLEKHTDLLELFWKEMDLTWALLDMEARGMAVDVEYLQSTLKEYSSKRLTLELELRDLVGREDFNPRSDDQVREYLNAQGIHSGVKTAKSKKESFAAEVLAGIDHPFAEKLLSYKKINKLCNTFLGPMLEEQANGILHVNIRQHGTVTGRVSSGEVDRE